MRRRLARPGSSRGGGDHWPTSSELTVRAAVIPSCRRCRGDPGRMTSRRGARGPSSVAGSQHMRRRRRAVTAPLAPPSDEGTRGGRGGGPPCSPWICRAGAGGRATVLEAAAPPLLKAAGEEDLRACMAGSSICTWILRGPRALRLQARGDGATRRGGGELGREGRHEFLAPPRHRHCPCLSAARSPPLAWGCRDGCRGRWAIGKEREWREVVKRV
jgi:hypothetical protein